VKKPANAGAVSGGIVEIMSAQAPVSIIDLKVGNLPDSVPDRIMRQSAPSNPITMSLLDAFIRLSHSHPERIEQLLSEIAAGELYVVTLCTTIRHFLVFLTGFTGWMVLMTSVLRSS
jgi:hypothetical protein